MPAMNSADLKQLFREHPQRTQAQLARALGLDATKVSKMLSGVRKVGPDERAKILAFFGISPPLNEGSAPERPWSRSENLVNTSDAEFLRLLAAPDRRDLIPVLGAAEGGADGSFHFNGETVDRIPRPPFLAGATHGYALFVVGESMAPRYLPGETVYIHPGRPVTVGSYVLLQLRAADGQPPLAFLKRLVRRTAKTVFVEQFNPPKVLEIPADHVISIHKIVGSGDA